MHCLVTRLHLCLGSRVLEGCGSVLCVCVLPWLFSLVSLRHSGSLSGMAMPRGHGLRQKRGRLMRDSTVPERRRLNTSEALSPSQCPCTLWVASQHDPIRHLPALCSRGREKPIQYSVCTPSPQRFRALVPHNQRLNVSGTLLGTRPVPLRTAASCKSNCPVLMS